MININTHDLPLVIYTLLQQISIGCFILLGIFILFSKDRMLSTTISKRFFFIIALMLIGLIASTFHLGTPLRGINAFNRLGKAWLSNEVFITGLFIGSAGIFWLIAMFSYYSSGLRRLFLILTMFLGLALLGSMSMLYMIETVPSWDSWYTPASFILSCLIGGSLFGQLMLLRLKTPAYLPNILNFIGIIALFLSVITFLLQVNLWQITESAITNALMQVNDYKMYIHVYLSISSMIFIVWLGIYMCASNSNSNSIKIKPTMLFIIIVLVFTAQVISRALFYAVHMSVGL